MPENGNRLDRIEAALQQLMEVADRLAERQIVAQGEIENQRVNIESLHATASEHTEQIQQHTEQIRLLLATAQRDGENIRALTRIVEIHERRISDLEDSSGGE